MKNKSAKAITVSLAVFVLLMAGGVVGVRYIRRANHIRDLKQKKNLTGLVAWWPGDGDATDLISGKMGILENGAGFAPGISGQAFDFPMIRVPTLQQRLEAVGQWLLSFFRLRRSTVFFPFPRYPHIHVADGPELHLTSGMTLEAWIYPTSQMGYTEVIGKWSAVNLAQLRESYTFGADPGNHIYIGVTPNANGNGSQSVYAKSVLPMNTWTHVAGTYDGKTLNIYVNGQLENSVPYSAGIYPGTYDLGLGGVVGDGRPGQSGSPFFGRMCDLSIYNRALTADELKAEMAAFRGN
jgi:hypothetical protein